MDKLFAQEKETLNECSKFVAEDGTLIYIIYTVSKKEGHQTILDFLANHPDFHFVKEEQRYPYDEGETSVYYAVLHKDSNSATVGTPLNLLFGKETLSQSQTSLAEHK